MVNDQFLAPLFEALKNRRLSLFIGSDLPQSITGLPSRKDLALGLARKHQLDENMSLASVAQRVSLTGRRREFTNFLRDMLDTTDLPLSPFHQRIAVMVNQHRIETIITTSYDNMLELAFIQAGMAYNRVVKNDDLNFINSNWLTLIKFYGDISQPSTLIVTESDHARLINELGHKPLVDEVRQTFRHNTVLFLGYNLSDPDFRFLFEDVAKNRFSQMSYAAWPGMVKDEARAWSDLGIVILEVDPFDALPKEASPLSSGMPNTEREAYIPSGVFSIRSKAGEAGTAHHPTVPASRIFLKLQLVSLGLRRMRVLGLDVPRGGSPKADVDLPFTLNQLKAVLKALELGEYLEDRFRPEYVAVLEDMGLLLKGRLHADFHKVIGQMLFQSMFRGEILTELRIAQSYQYPIACQFCFDPEDVLLAQFPWELIYDQGVHLLKVKGGLELTRSLNITSPPKPLERSLPMRLLWISPRPENGFDLPQETEKKALQKALEPLQRRGQLNWEEVNPPTWEALEENLNTNEYDVIHFDGHGVFARLCPVCGEAHYPSSEECVVCKAEMRDTEASGYLYFEDRNRSVDRVSAADMKAVLTNNKISLVVLSSCSSAVVQGTSVFNGIAPGLIETGIPAVVGMQSSPTVEAMIGFMKRMYTGLAEYQDLPAAVNRSRLAISRLKPPAWFMPVVYLRSSDTTHGRLFVKGGDDG